MTTPLTSTDITADLRFTSAKAREFRTRAIVSNRWCATVGPFVTLVFENRDTIRFQIQEMAGSRS